ncbi:hypothetical protein PVAND_014051 [Polypedilum vanderplanki]|uniref:Uncharacterized protein n=1 Tax=Polypedilum vanderplanki TaxID=319348 RepID=A0A9J6CSC3_POLVA|nr:hypothetical protein PVAND_014051 [Polypedilum vanderplanki]
MKRENSVESGEDWYKNFQCRADNKSCNIQISEQPKESKIVVEKLQKPKQPERQKEENNEKNMAKQVLLSGHRHYFHHDAAESSNDNADAINRLLHAKTSLASQQNEIHEIELKHQHLTTSATFLENEKFSLNENQLLETQPVINEESSNGNFHSSNFDTSLSSSERGKRSSGQKQKHYDDQFNLKKNTLYDELLELNDSEVGKQHQQWERYSNEPHNRVKRRDVINQINRNDGLSKSIDYDSNGNRLMNYCEYKN